MSIPDPVARSKQALEEYVQEAPGKHTKTLLLVGKDGDKQYLVCVKNNWQYAWQKFIALFHGGSSTSVNKIISYTNDKNLGDLATRYKISILKTRDKNLLGKIVRVFKHIFFASSVKEPKNNEYYSQKLEQIRDKTVYEGLGAEQTVLRFASKILDVEPNTLSLQVVTPGLTSGVTGSPVYLVKDQNSQTLRLVVKGNYLQAAVENEAKTLLYLQDLKMKKCKSPVVAGITEMKSGTRSYYFLAEQPVVGKPIDSYIEEVAKNKDTARNSQFTHLKKALKKAAEGIAELHQRGQSDKTENPGRAKVVEDYKNSFSNFLASLPEALLKQSQKDALQKMADKVPFSSRGAITHTDFHVGNAFYEDKEPHTFSIIDCDLLRGSYDLESFEPIGVSAYDIAYFTLWIQAQGTLKGLTESEIKILQDEFNKTYLHHNPKASQEELGFMRVYIALKYYSELSYVLQTPGHPMYQAIGKESLENLISFLAAAIKSSPAT